MNTKAFTDLRKKTSLEQATRITPNTITYTARYERYGLFGMYHVSLVVDSYRNGVRLTRVHIDGAGRFPQQQLNLGFINLKFRIPPARLVGSVNPKGYKMHFLGLLESNEFGPTFTLTEQQGIRLVSMAHKAITSMNNDQWIYCTMPVHLGPIHCWTSNSVVASLINVANQEGIKLPKPADGCYPGFDGPFLPSSLYQY